MVKMKVLRCAVLLLAVGGLVTLADSAGAESGGFLSKMGCVLCKVKASRYLALVRLGLTSAVTTEARLLCVVFSGYSGAVCTGIIARWQARVEYIARHSRVSAAEVCGSLLESCQFSVAQHWAVELPPPPDHHSHRYKPPAGHGRQLKVLQIADVHLQLDYAPGSATNCKNKLFCCRARDGHGKGRHVAGAWGSYEHCDSPPSLLYALLKHLKHQHPDIAYVLWTGDNAPHSVHETSRSQTLASNRAVTEAIQDTFPDTLVIPALGNHDTHPVNSFPPPHVPSRFSNAWLLSELDHMWRPLLRGSLKAGYDTVHHENSFSETFNPLGYYHIRAPDSGLRILAVNTNYCYRYNFWTLLFPRDPAGQLQWLVGQLAEAEAAGEVVHIVGHVSPGDPSCRPDWSHQYSRIVHRFASTIGAQFFSHTHLDEFQVAVDGTGRAVSTVYIAPSLSPWTNLNPGYKIYSVDQTSWTVTDTERWFTDLEAANRRRHEAPVWRRLYSARPEYGLTTLAPDSWLALAHRMAHSRGLFQRVYRNYWGASRRRERCKAACRRQILCHLVTFDRQDHRQCELIQHRLRA